MEFGTYARQRLVSFVTALLGTATALSFMLGDIALAQDAAPPACDAKMLEKCTPNSGDTAWMLTSVALVLMMTVPGLGLFYGGMVRKKNVGDTVMTSFAITCLVTIIFAVLHLQHGLPRRHALHRRASTAPSCKGILSDIGKGHRQSQSARADHSRSRLHVLPDDVRDHHAGADRRRLRRAHEVLGDAVVHRAVGDLRLCADRALGVGTGRLPELRPTTRLVKVLDFAGGTVVHINAGVAGLMCALMLGKRKDTGPAHNMVLTFIGASLLWVGWFGFNAGSAVTAGMQAGMAMTVTQIATAVGGARLDVRGMGAARQADGDRHLLGRGRRPRRHHAGLRLRRPCRRARDRRRRRRRLLLGLHRPQAHVRL